ncbi:unnamed protein product [Cyprideis torosa]|uniref:Uncharacterized protein n=1 Tax=Cyprideis torosa TaxID=163714 RepID=A0A7R8ZMI7_9CRUS|nr:unnamed protein product [Cyprideis torosa]CAG0894287.1 unnamed protein product [Cyprideis torosa]
MEELNAEESTGVPSSSAAHLKELKDLPTEERQHTLDSDDEGEGSGDEEANRKYDVLRDDDIEGQEETGVGLHEGDNRMTAFNVREEMEEGHFDTEGNFIWNKDKDIRDHWLDNVDWVKVEHGKRAAKEAEDESDEEENAAAAAFDEKAVYREILEMMQPGESVNGALKRLGGGGKKQKRLTTQERWKRKKAGLPVDDGAEEVTKLTGLADSILSNSGHMDVYQETFESISLKLMPPKPSSPVVDMFAEMESEEGGKKEEVGAKGEEPGPEGEEPPATKKRKVEFASTNGDEKDSSETKEAPSEAAAETQWEYKTSESSPEVLGPFQTKEMMDKMEAGVFGETGVLCRRVGHDRWYQSDRIDFELFLDD